MTEIIRDMVAKAKPGYSRNNEPSRFLLHLILVVTAMPLVLLITQYFGP